ncbi:uncharacterized protein CEXT_98291 [Caerostris extrusa]|uniref:Uncharacterized protein n=1 Tax=Caerostris extrusa TaxID=172846 RepID=A0AAV4PFU8_CAEEX|nr:uncharacterized protein CEXT_98291 [Caerostris extrusa]
MFVDENFQNIDKSPSMYDLLSTFSREGADVHYHWDISEEEKEDEEKDRFYEELDHFWERCPRHDVQIIMVTLMPKCGKEEEFCAVIGSNSLHSISNENGNRVLSFATSHNMVLGSTLFQHKNIHKITWRSPDDST